MPSNMQGCCGCEQTPQTVLLNLNGFLVSFIAAGAVFRLVPLATRAGATGEGGLALFFHRSLD